MFRWSRFYDLWARLSPALHEGGVAVMSGEQAPSERWQQAHQLADRQRKDAQHEVA